MVNQLLKIFSKCYELLILTPCPQAMYMVYFFVSLIFVATWYLLRKLLLELIFQQL